MLKKWLSKNFLVCTAIIIGITQYASAQALSISIYPAEGFILELDPNNQQTNIIFTIYNDGQNSVSLDLQVESADSTYLLYTEEPDSNTYDGNIWMMRPNGSEKTQLTYDTLDQGPVWSPDGSKIAFYSNRSGNVDVWVMDSDGTNMINLTNHDSSDSYPHWSPDGQYIIFSSDRDDPNEEIYRMTANGTNVQRLTYNDLLDINPRYSPDGQHFVTRSRIPGEASDIYVYTSDGQSYVNIGVPNVYHDFQPSWTPDGKRVVWASGNHNIGELDIVSANKDSSDFHLEFATPANDYIPRYSPDGQFLAFSKSTFYPTGGDEIFVWHKVLDSLTQITDSTPVTREWGPDWSPFLNSPSWLLVDQGTAQIVPEDSISIVINVDASVLPFGHHTASVMIHDASNNNLLAVVPVNLFFVTTVTQVQNVTHNTDNIQLTVFNDGIIGFDTISNIGIGFIFDGYSNALYSGGAIIGSEVNGSTGSIYNDQDNVNIAPMNDFTSNDDFDQISETKFTDTNAPSPFGVVVKQRTFSNSGDDYVYFNYTIINATFSDISGLYVGIFADWDVGDYSLNRGGYDESRNLTYQYEYGSPNDPNYYGIVALSGLGGARVTTEWPGVSQFFEFMSTFNNEVITTNGDYRTFIGSGPYNILIGESIEVGFAFIAGESLEDLQTNTDLTIAYWNSVKVNVEDNSSNLPLSFELRQNYPNPFNPSTTIRYGLEKDSHVLVEIYDISGKLISTLYNNNQTQGWHSVIWNGTNHQDEQVPTGLYFSKITSDNDVKTIKLMLLK